jgi:peptidoglycan/LPS O-acetylase OafA/YrhL
MSVWNLCLAGALIVVMPVACLAYMLQARTVLVLGSLGALAGAVLLSTESTGGPSVFHYIDGAVPGAFVGVILALFTKPSNRRPRRPDDVSKFLEEVRSTAQPAHHPKS